MKTSNVRKWFTLLLAATLSCCLIGVAVVMASSSKENYSGAKYAPEIIVDYEDFDANNIPDAVLNKPYKIFNATAEDLYGKNIYVGVRVWIYYDSATRSLINVSNSTILPTEYGIYTVEYKAIDRWNNVSTVLYDFVCKEKDSLSAIVGSDSAVYETGNEITVNIPEFVNNIGAVNYAATAVLRNSNVNYSVSDGKFVPLYSGVYDIVYSYSDYNESGESSYPITVEANGQLVWKRIPSVEEYSFVGYEYEIMSAYAYSFDGGVPTENPATITVIDPDNVESVLGSDRLFVPEKEGVYTFKFSVVRGAQNIEISKTSYCLDVGGFDGSDMDMSRYFVGDVFTKSITSYGVQLSTTVNGATAKFVNRLSSRLAHVEFSVVAATANNFDSVDIILTDAENPDCAIAFNLAKDGTDGGIFSVLGGKSVKTDADFYSSAAAVLEYDNQLKVVYLADTEKITVKKDLNGNEFKGFLSDSIYVSVRLNGVKANSAIKVLRLGNQVLYDEVGDGVGPEIILSRWLGGEVVVGDIVSLERVYLHDVLCPSVSVSYFVKGPSGEYITSLDGVVMSGDNTDYTKSYQFKIEQDGRYIVCIRATDYFGNETVYDYPVVSVSAKMLTVSIADDGAKSGKVGNEIGISSFTVNGYNKEELLIRTFVITPDSQVLEIKDGKFKATVSGEYRVWYYVSDSNNNFDMVYYTVKIA